METTQIVRRLLMADYAAAAREHDRTGDVVLRAQASQNWRDLASTAEAKRAPKYLTWPGR